MQLPRSYRPLLLVALIGLNIATWYVWFHPAPPRLRVSVLDIGQGDSIMVQGPTGVQMLVDGGPDQSVLRQLPREMGLFDRSIDLVVETHPDKDHIAGLTDVFDRYRVSYFMSPGIPGTTATSQRLDDAVAHEPGVHTFTARRGMRIHLGGGAYADVLYPDRDVSKGETNEGSIVMHVVYGTTTFMLTGDAPSDVEDHLVALDAGDGELPTTVLKAGHHGSKYSTDDAWLAALHPQYVAISAGANNTYGHPNPETIARIKNEGAKMLNTIDLGTLRFVSDGKELQIQ
ncbi:MAG TPA: MBL fold metallo-hydrolase [Candidatus Paceibacterota bacterium]|nr:MBL fold metallo-hydrolase [Candidatus Paceibacterota bacterium]